MASGLPLIVRRNYYATYYSAEIVNSLTNLFFAYLAYKGIKNNLENGHDQVFLAAFISYLIIGIGSFIFHTTLKYSMQLLDELAMVYTTCILFHATFSHGRSTATKISVAALTIGIAAFVTGYYHYLGDPKFHQDTFALLTAIVVFYNIYLMEKTLRHSPEKGPTSGQANIAEDARRLQTMWSMIPVGIGSVALGFGIWTLDNVYCTRFRVWRREVGLPWGILLEGHGWWHFFTSIAEYYNIVWCTWLRYCYDGKQDQVEMIWPSLWTSMPKLERIERKKNL